MAINVPNYNNQFIQTVKTTGQAFNNAAKYGVEVKPVVNMGNFQQYWRVVGIHHLTGDENRGNHHAYCDVLDESGKRINNSRVSLNQGAGSQPLEAVVDKPPNEAGTNIPMWSSTKGDLGVKWPANNPLPSEQAGILRTDHADEPPGNTWGHHSFYVVFQRTPASTPLPPKPDPTPVPPKPTPTPQPTPTPTPQPTPTPTPTPQPTPTPTPTPTPQPPPTTPFDPSAVLTLEEAITAAGQPIILPLNTNAMFYRVAKQRGLGERMTREYTLDYGGKTYQAQMYEKGIIYAEVGKWNNVFIIPRTN